MLQKKNFISLDNIALFLISVLPIGLLISTGVSELISILLVILFIIKSFTKKIYNGIKIPIFLF